MKIKTLLSLEYLKKLRTKLKHTLIHVTVGGIFLSPISYSFRVYQFGETIGFYQFFHDEKEK